MRTILLCGMLCALVGVGWVIAADDKPCQKPNPSDKACRELPDSAVASCVDVLESECAQGESVNVYEVKNFPDGVIKTAEGVTTTEPRPCWRSRGCHWDRQQTPPRCVDNELWLSWRLQNRIEVNSDPEKKCPIE